MRKLVGNSSNCFDLFEQSKSHADIDKAEKAFFEADKHVEEWLSKASIESLRHLVCEYLSIGADGIRALMAQKEIPSETILIVISEFMKKAKIVYDSSIKGDNGIR